jgi:hypothetical protein
MLVRSDFQPPNTISLILVSAARQRDREKARLYGVQDHHHTLNSLFLHPPSPFQQT